MLIWHELFSAAKVGISDICGMSVACYIIGRKRKKKLYMCNMRVFLRGKNWALFYFLRTFAVRISLRTDYYARIPVESPPRKGPWAYNDSTGTPRSMRRFLHCAIGACGEPYRDMAGLRILVS